MLTYGMALTQSHDPLQRIALGKVVQKIKQPRPEFKARIDQLRRIKELNPKQYRHLKTGLPYFCGGLFKPAYRKKENFAALNVFTLDFDQFSESGLKKEAVQVKLSKDKNIRFLFTSPGGDGLKAIFELDTPCSDAGEYAHFYKVFAQHIVKEYGLEKVIDWVTHDVTRATFFSADEEAWDNPNAQPVNRFDYISEEVSSEFSFTEKAFTKAAKENKSTPPPTNQGPDDEALINIKSKLNPNYKPKKKKQIYVPLELTEVMPLIEKTLAEEDIRIAAIVSINYGKQIRVKLRHLWAELNIFYGQKGFSVVKSTKTGCNTALTELAYQKIDALLND